MYSHHNPCFDLHHLSPIRMSSNPVHNYFNALKCSWCISVTNGSSAVITNCSIASCSYNKFDTFLTGSFSLLSRFTLSWRTLVITANIIHIVSLSSAYTFTSPSAPTCSPPSLLPYSIICGAIFSFFYLLYSLTYLKHM
ncbi:hypothetical protein C8J55DRAFT_499469 [Lentinula edodes]|uniref:Uncharacterized protein n=1 Tax=Lentinula lateritia TaxID=40482 RepID=A0A9W9B0A9_9AGAR|nr:hypothetical protein C8J55DRAFT_499469 [Lentinula edodes]